jgi:hypothetical protein
MAHKNHLVLTALILGILHSCDINEPIYVPDDISYVAFTNSTAAIRENKGPLKVEMYLATYATQPAEFTVSSSTDGLDLPALEGVDYNLPPGSTVKFENGMGYIDIPIEIIDNDEKDGMKQFWLKIESGSPEYQLGIDGKDKILITIQDDEHPLKFILGRYRIEAVSYYGSQWDIAHDRFLIEPDVDTTKVLINNVIEGISPPLSRPLIGTMDVENGTITVKSGQQWSNPKSNGYYFSFYMGDPDNANSQGPEPLDEVFILTYTISESGTTISGFNNWGPKWMEPAGTFDSWWWWDYYLTASLTKVEDY